MTTRRLAGVAVLHCVLTIGAMVGTQAVHAARSFTPQAGTWIVTSELNGKPGRGLAIDVQGNTLFMQVFSYEKNGSATFYTATGQMQGDSATAPLMRYVGGRSFGSDARVAHQDSSPGNVTVSFRNGLQGTVQFPGEAPVAMQRFLVQEGDPDYQNLFDKPDRGGKSTWRLSRRYSRWVALDSQQNPVASWMTLVERFGSDNDKIVLSMFEDRSTSSSDSLEPERLLCQEIAGPDYLSCVPDDSANAPAGQFPVEKVTFRRVGADYQGSIQFKNATMGTSQTAQLQGTAVYAESQRSPGLELNVQSSMNWRTPGACILPCPTSVQIDNMPSNGTWIVSDELNGLPGRGISLDVQDTVALVQVFDYREDGQPSFHMGVGRYLNSQTGIALQRYQGGRYFGSPALVAAKDEDAGDALFDLRPQRGKLSMVQGQLQFPRESSKPIQRLALETSENWQDQLFGTWVLTGDKRTVLTTLDRTDGDVVTNAQASVRCTLVPAIPLNNVVCDWVGADVSAPERLFSNPVGNLAFRGNMQFWRIKDRHGNLTGLGAMPDNH